MTKGSSSLSLLGAVASAAGVVVGVGYLIYRYSSRSEKKSFKKVERLRKEPPHPILGDAVAAMQNMDRLYDYWLEIVEERLSEGNTGPFMIAFPFNPPTFYLLTEESFQHVLKDKFSVYDKGQIVHSRLKDVLGDGIFNADGETWRHQRKTAANIFNVKNFKDFVGNTFVEEITIFTGLLADSAAAGKVFDLQDLFFRFTLDSFCKIAFGAELHSLESTTPIPFALAFDDAQLILFKRFVAPLWEIVDYWTGVAARQAQNVKTIKSFTRNLVDTRFKELAAGTAKTSTHDLLSFLMDSTVPMTGKPPTRDDLVDYVINYVIAGRDTTAQALSWTFFMLDRHPHVAEILHKEITEVSANLRADEHVSYDQIKAMKYANAVFHETLRLYPSVPSQLKQANQDDYLPDGTFIPKGSVVTYHAYVTARLSMFWGEDAKVFRPERWLEMDKQPSPFKYTVFNGGPRVCLGKNLAELEGVFVMVEILRKFVIQVVDPQSVKYAPSLTLPMKNGLKVKVSLR